MKAFPKLREKLFPKSAVKISTVFGEEVKSLDPVSPPASENLHPAAKEGDSEPERLELTPELEEALFPKTPLMISATFERSDAKEAPPEAPKENRSIKFEGEQDFPIV